MSRVYLALGREGARALRESGRVASDVRAYAVTGFVREAFPDDDVEDLEYDAFAVAAEHCPEPVLVAAADVPDRVVRPEVGELPEDEQGWRVRLEGDVPLRCVVSLHVPDPDVPPAEADSAELLWFDVGELDALLGDVPGA